MWSIASELVIAVSSTAEMVETTLELSIRG